MADTSPANGRRTGRRMLLIDALLAALVLLLALLPRARDLDVFLTPDELRWTCRSANFHAALRSGDLAETYRKEHPGVITMWLGSLGQDVDPSSDWAKACRTIPPSKVVGWTTPKVLAEIRDHLFVARVRIAWFVALGVAGIYLLAARLFDRRTAVLAAMLIALDPLYLALARVLHLDAITATLMTLSLLALFLALRRSTPEGGADDQLRRVASRYRFIVLSGLFGGLAALNKSPAMFLAPFVLLAALADGWRAARRPADVARTVIAWGCVAAVTYIAFWPAMWVTPVRALQGVLGGALGYAAAPHEGSNYFWGAIREDPGPFFYPVAWAMRTTPLVMLGLVLALVRLARRRDDPADRAAVAGLVGFAILFGLFMTFGEKKFDRYLVPIFPPLVLVAAVGLAAGVRWVTRWVGQRVGAARAEAVVWGGAVAGALLLQAGLVLPHHPYYFSYYNPLTGGAPAAEWALLVGWGEGLEQAARFLNAQPDPTALQVATRYRSAFGPLFRGETLEMDDLDPASLDYYLVYSNQVQRNLDPELLAETEEMTPAFVTRFQGLDYAWLYPNENYRPALDYIASRARADGDAIVVRGDSQLAKHYDGPLPLVTFTPDDLEGGILPLLARAFRDHEQLWYVRYDDIFPRPGLAAVDYQLATRAYSLLDRPFPGLRVRLLAADAPPTFGTDAADVMTTAVFGDELALTGYGFSATPVRWGRALGVSLAWRALGKADTNLTGFLHLIGPDGRRWAQTDKPITNADLRPTSQWPSDGGATDHAYLTIPAGTPPGRYRLQVGVYDSASKERLAATVDGRSLDGDVLEIEIEVARSPFVPHVDALDLAEVVEAPVGGGIELVGYGIGGAVEGGGTAGLTTVWRARSKPDDGLLVRLAAFDSSGAEVGRGDFDLASAAFPTTAWEAGDVVRGWQDLPLSGRARLGTGRLELLVLRPDGTPATTGGPLVLPLDITGPARFDQPPDGITRVMADLGGRVRLLGFDGLGLTEDRGLRGPSLLTRALTTCTPGEEVPIDLYWQVLAELDTEYRTFVHLTDKSGTDLWGQSDVWRPEGETAPLRPTTWWLPGEVVYDHHRIVVRSDTPAGRYDLRAGMYRVDDPGRKVTVTDADGDRPLDERALLGEIEVRP